MGEVIVLMIELLGLGWASDLVNPGKRSPLLGKTVSIAAVVALNIAMQPLTSESPFVLEPSKRSTSWGRYSIQTQHMPSKLTEIYVRVHGRNILVSIVEATDESEPQADVVEPDREPEPAVSVGMDVDADGAVDLDITKTVEADISIDRIRTNLCPPLHGFCSVYCVLTCFCGSIADKGEDSVVFVSETGEHLVVSAVLLVDV
ncbi:hypothetical protein BP00DRAFT_412208 [Aspergillus indologenus CBS 114.80]|uniref:Uncharacterized protein n=1 Tax=Aspergillus indologenus CBS 114.80 TaxID=1450541 RepID=A0A2V5ILX0_9EURO|nr:hypothetical protein BP00DRAFT_412208 [Aspergillus indologenus CBS 114.80]